MIGPVEIRLPADPQLSRVARLAASGLGAMAGFDVALIDDVKIAVSEVLLALVEQGALGPICLTLHVDGPAFTIRGTTDTPSFDLNAPDLALCRTVLSGIAASHDVIYADGTAEIWAVVRDLDS